MLTDVQTEEIEKKYLDKYFFLLKALKDDILEGLDTKENIRSDWETFWGSNISSFSTGAERIIYSLLHGQIVGKINSSPVGSDLFFELKDAYIHIDIKTVVVENIGDYRNGFVIGENQHSYKSEIMSRKSKTPKSFSPKRFSNPSLPTYYNKTKTNEKICLSYFINILTENKGKDVICMYLASMPNGQLTTHYKFRPLSAGKNPDSKVLTNASGEKFQYGEARYCISEVNKFELLEGEPSRIRIIYIDEDKYEKHKSKKILKDSFDELYKTWI
ncbi:hypothetical protein QUR76_10390 [Arcobacter cryaerophilus gv. pseudocryaerophilus]|uniref:Restriction endonuclease n=3 Tax=unclassified Arcobacter TaxID=2593671 RepID=A0AA96DRT2_9BACT|nr:hypothetical protein RMQ65_08535 [Arcobacter sp. AZ-2023]WPD05512.1 hypothetical protein QUR76_10390 [Arcobacter sp. DSM 115956]WPD07604.1 hypothetical protein QUR78_10385 [Arcobacter sp. DSM 115955]WNL31870.1 hypothetical protein RMQ67_10380 [Arcobacter sp. AZ-2023]WNP38020.1 hypothetical protein RJG58_10380 [Arcobacter sp. AZ-2023]